MTERETLKLLQIGVLTNIIPYNMDKKTPHTPRQRTPSAL